MQRMLLEEPAIRADDWAGWRAAQEDWARVRYPLQHPGHWRAVMAFWSAAFHAVYTDHVRIGRREMMPGSRPWLDEMLKRDGQELTAEPYLAGIHSDLDPDRWPDLAERADEALTAFANFYAVCQIHWVLMMIPARLRDPDHDEQIAAVADREAMLKAIAKAANRRYRALRDEQWGGSVEPKPGASAPQKARPGMKQQRMFRHAVTRCDQCTPSGGRHEPYCLVGLLEGI